MFVKTVSKNTVSLENSSFPKLGVVEKSFLHELMVIRENETMNNRR